MNTEKYSAFLLVFIFSAILLFASACGSSSHSTATNLTQQQVEALTAGMIQQAVSVSSVTPASCVGGGANQECFSATVNCPGGGTIELTGISTDNTTNGSGQFVDTATLIPKNCAIQGTNLVTNGDPSIVFNDVENFQNSVLTDSTVTATGAYSYGPDPSGVCETNITMKQTYGSTKSCTITGTACGKTVNLTCKLP